MSKIDHSLFSAHEHALQEAYGNCPECQAPLKLKRGKTGVFVGCSRYPDCHYTKALHESESTQLKVIDGSTCPDCGSVLAIKKGRYGLFIGCTKFPECHHMAPIKQQDDTHITCPSCDNGHLLKRSNKYGKTFYACNGYPKCRYVVNDPPVDKACPQCGWRLLVRKRHQGQAMLSCPQRQCDYQTADAE